METAFKKLKLIDQQLTISKEFLTMKQTINKKMNEKLSELSIKAMMFKESVKEQWIKGKKKTSRAKTIFSAFLLLLGISLIALPHMANASTDFSRDKTLSSVAKTVKDETQGSMVKILLNIAGVVTSAYAIFTQRWTMFALGGAYLIFVYVYFGWVNERYK
jgi:hypothetical protein